MRLTPQNDRINHSLYIFDIKQVFKLIAKLNKETLHSNKLKLSKQTQKNKMYYINMLEVSYVSYKKNVIKSFKLFIFFSILITLTTIIKYKIIKNRHFNI